MNRYIESFLRDPTFSLLKQERNYYIFKDQKTLKEMKIVIISDEKVSIEIKDHF